MMKAIYKNVMMYISAFAITLLVSQNSLASSVPLERPYHCPSYSDIKYKVGHIYADTKYNGMSVNWTSEEFHTGKITKIKFVMAKEFNCPSASCRVVCKYDMNNSEDNFTLEMLYGNYEVTKVGGKNWDLGGCAAANPEQCEFNVTSRL